MERDQNRKKSLLGTLGLLTGLIIFSQIAIMTAHFSANQFIDIAVSYSLQPTFFYSKIIAIPLLRFVLIQAALYVMYLFTIWYLAVSMGELFKFRWKNTYYLGILLGCVGWAGIFSANSYYFPHSFFTQFIRDYLFNYHLTHTQIMAIWVTTVSIFFVVGLLTLINLFMNLYAKRNLIRHAAVIAIIFSLFIALPSQAPSVMAAQTNKPNVIIIGFDALRPDCIGKNNICKARTPYLNSFLQSSFYFVNAYTPLARTSPSWTSILTGKYPKHHGARDNNVDMNLIQLNETLPKRLQAAGYETLYATDDRRYNNINEAFGFDHVIGPPAGLNDFLIGTLNDFPLSNLLVFSPWGAKLFPYNYANHCVSSTYNPDHFLQLIDKTLAQRNDKPLFLAVHFNVGGWPFHWYNDNQPENVNINMTLYQRAVEKTDQQLGNFLQILEQRNMLSNTIVVILSDHGITLGLHGDRAIAKRYYQGQLKLTDKLSIAQYSNTPQFSTDFKNNYGLDTSYGYGGDILSLKQSHALLALKAYGMNIGKPHIVNQTVSLIDIAPTLLAYLSLSPLAQGDGLSLKNYSANPQRPFYFETGLRDSEIEKETILVGTALKNVMNNYQISPETGLIYINKKTLNKLISNKEHAIIQGNWLLAHYPRSKRMALKVDPQDSHKRILGSDPVPAYFVLMNLKTHQWTMEWNTALANQAPLKELFSQLATFYGDELKDSAP